MVRIGWIPGQRKPLGPGQISCNWISLSHDLDLQGFFRGVSTRHDERWILNRNINKFDSPTENVELQNVYRTTERRKLPNVEKFYNERLNVKCCPASKN